MILICPGKPGKPCGAHLLWNGTGQRKRCPYCGHKFAVHVKVGWRTGDGKPPALPPSKTPGGRSNVNTGVVVKHDGNGRVAGSVQAPPGTGLAGKTASTKSQLDANHGRPAGLPEGPSGEKVNLPTAVGIGETGDKTASTNSHENHPQCSGNAAPATNNGTGGKVNSVDANSQVAVNSSAGASRVPAALPRKIPSKLEFKVGIQLCLQRKRQFQIATNLGIDRGRLSRIVKGMVDDGIIFKQTSSHWNVKARRWEVHEHRGFYDPNPVYFPPARKMEADAGGTLRRQEIVAANVPRRLAPIDACKVEYKRLRDTSKVEWWSNGTKHVCIRDWQLGFWAWRNYQLADYKVWLFPGYIEIFPYGKGPTKEAALTDYDNFVRSVQGLIEQFTGERVKFKEIAFESKRQMEVSVEPETPPAVHGEALDEKECNSPRHWQKNTLQFKGPGAFDQAVQRKELNNAVVEHGKEINDLKLAIPGLRGEMHQGLNEIKELVVSDGKSRAAIDSNQQAKLESVDVRLERMEGSFSKLVDTISRKVDELVSKLGEIGGPV